MLGHETNTPANIRRIAEIAAELRGVPLAQLAEITEQNVDPCSILPLNMPTSRHQKALPCHFVSKPTHSASPTHIHE